MLDLLWYTTTFDIQTLEIASIVSRDFRLDDRPSGRNRQIDTAVELNAFSSCKRLEFIQLLP
jgi:hypothetical protein